MWCAFHAGSVPSPPVKFAAATLTCSSMNWPRRRTASISPVGYRECRGATSCTEDRARLCPDLVERVLPRQTVKKVTIVTRPHQGARGKMVHVNVRVDNGPSVELTWRVNLMQRFRGVVGGRVLWHQDNNLLLAATRNVIYLISHEAEIALSACCTSHLKPYALCGVLQMYRRCFILKAHFIFVQYLWTAPWM